MVYSEFTVPFNPFVPMSKKIIYCLFFFLFILSCGKKEKPLTHQEGEMTIYADPSNKVLLEALTEIYTVKYPKVKFNFVYKPENQIIKDLQDTLATAAFINKPLSEQQTKYIAQKTNVTPRSTLLAYDAVIFITSPQNPMESISLDEIKSGIMEDKLQIIFDDGNSGNFNTVREVLNLKLPQGKAIQALNNVQELIEFIQKAPKAIGVIGMNEISEKDNPKVKEILSKIKILKVLNEENKAIEPSVPNILAMEYPFSKGVYFIVREPGFGIGSGFSRFAGSNQGQLIVKRAGLQPNFLYDREIQVNLQSVE